ncbi:hypothetical protein [Streptomyces sp. W1SF4]|uniref:hypothetical protein n=1 Tax=Streptomyces sp. W1SF4 TaxID=2305220 RepID=UPI000F6C9DF1|nr:hypothetical protein [Streptomyces sp. W1SF4]AZM93856.1 hypothetical protein D1J60_35680 [Streptomyces sp. W1SF4]
MSPMFHRGGETATRTRPHIALAVEVILGAALAATALSQHPLRVFDRLRALDRTGLILPDWRLFAPVPVTHDLHLLYRPTRGGSASDWEVVSRIAERTARHMVWFPERREQKAVLDLCRELSFHAAQGLPDPDEKPAYRILRDWLRTRTNERHPDAEGFQFMIMSAAGYDEGVTPQCVFVSPLEHG